MRSLLKHKGYFGTVECLEDDNLLCGETVSIRELIMYH